MISTQPSGTACWASHVARRTAAGQAPADLDQALQRGRRRSFPIIHRRDETPFVALVQDSAARSGHQAANEGGEDEEIGRGRAGLLLMGQAAPPSGVARSRLDERTLGGPDGAGALDGGDLVGGARRRHARLQPHGKRRSAWASSNSCAFRPAPTASPSISPSPAGGHRCPSGWPRMARAARPSKIPPMISRSESAMSGPATGWSRRFRRWTGRTR